MDEDEDMGDAISLEREWEEVWASKRRRDVVLDLTYATGMLRALMLGARKTPEAGEALKDIMQILQGVQERLRSKEPL